MFENTYLVTDKLETFTQADVDAAEAALSIRFPDGYREYVTTLGKGEYCGYVNIFPPSMIIREQTGEKPPLLEFCHSWDGSEFGVTSERLAKAVMVGNSIDGDWIIFEAGLPEAIYVLPRSEQIFHNVGPSLMDALIWLYEPEGNSRFRYFTSTASLLEEKHVSVPRNLAVSYEEFRGWILSLGKHDHFDERIQPNSASGSVMTYGLLSEGKVQIAQPGDEKHFQAFFKCLGGSVLCYVDMFGRLNLQIAYSREKGDSTISEIAVYLQSKAA